MKNKKNYHSYADFSRRFWQRMVQLYSGKSFDWIPRRNPRYPRGAKSLDILRYP
jgi:hypothetical protein